MAMRTTRQLLPSASQVPAFPVGAVADLNKCKGSKKIDDERRTGSGAPQPVVLTESLVIGMVESAESVEGFFKVLREMVTLTRKLNAKEISLTHISEERKTSRKAQGIWCQENDKVIECNQDKQESLTSPSTGN